MEQPKTVQVAGTFSKWQALNMNGTTGMNWVLIIELSPGTYQFKFIVDGRWVCNPDQETVDDGRGGKNNMLRVRESDSNVYKSLDMDYAETSQRKKTGR